MPLKVTKEISRLFKATDTFFSVGINVLTTRHSSVDKERPETSDPFCASTKKQNDSINEIACQN